MTQLVSFVGEDGKAMLVEVADSSRGTQRVAREDGTIVAATKKLEEALRGTVPTLRNVLEHIRELSPDSTEVEFGISLNAEAGVIVAKTAVTGNFTVRVSWDDSSGKG
jgi:hypothetical protein